METVETAPWWHKALRLGYWISFAFMMALVIYADPHSWIHGVPSIMLGVIVLALELMVNTREGKIIHFLMITAGFGLVTAGVYTILGYGGLL